MASDDKLHFRCSHCNKALAVPARKAGKRCKCPGCGASLVIPDDAASGAKPRERRESNNSARQHVDADRSQAEPPAHWPGKSCPRCKNWSLGYPTWHCCPFCGGLFPTPVVLIVTTGLIALIAGCLLPVFYALSLYKGIDPFFNVLCLLLMPVAFAVVCLAGMICLVLILKTTSGSNAARRLCPILSLNDAGQAEQLLPYLFTDNKRVIVPWDRILARIVRARDSFTEDKSVKLAVGLKIVEVAGKDCPAGFSFVLTHPDPDVRRPVFRAWRSVPGVGKSTVNLLLDCVVLDDQEMSEESMRALAKVSANSEISGQEAARLAALLPPRILRAVPDGSCQQNVGEEDIATFRALLEACAHLVREGDLRSLVYVRDPQIESIRMLALNELTRRGNSFVGDIFIPADEWRRAINGEADALIRAHFTAFRKAAPSEWVGAGNESEMNAVGRELWDHRKYMLAFLRSHPQDVDIETLKLLAKSGDVTVRTSVNAGAVDDFYEKLYEVDMSELRTLADAEIQRRQVALTIQPAPRDAGADTSRQAIIRTELLRFLTSERTKAHDAENDAYWSLGDMVLVVIQNGVHRDWGDVNVTDMVVDALAELYRQGKLRLNPRYAAATDTEAAVKYIRELETETEPLFRAK